MKILITILGVLCFLSSAQANFDKNCLDKAKSWIWSNTSASSSEAGERAITFCGYGGNYNCLDDAKSWIWSNTSASSNEAGDKAILFCRHGEVSCLDSTKSWIWSNTSANSNEAGERAVETCGLPKRCEQN